MTGPSHATSTRALHLCTGHEVRLCSPCPSPETHASFPEHRGAIPEVRLGDIHQDPLSNLASPLENILRHQYFTHLRYLDDLYLRRNLADSPRRSRKCSSTKISTCTNFSLAWSASPCFITRRPLASHSGLVKLSMYNCSYSSY